MTQQIVKVDQSFQFAGMQAAQKIPQRGVGGKLRQAEELLKGSVVGQDPGIGDSLEPGHHTVDQAEEQLGPLVGIDTPAPGNIALEEALQIELSTKLLKQEHSSVVSQGGILE